MMALFMITPLLGWSWPSLLPIAIAVASGYGYKKLTGVGEEDWLRGRLTTAARPVVPTKPRMVVRQTHPQLSTKSPCPGSSSAAAMTKKTSGPFSNLITTRSCTRKSVTKLLPISLSRCSTNGHLPKCGTM